MHCLSSLENQTRFQSKMHRQSLHPFSGRNGAKAMPFEAAISCDRTRLLPFWFRALSPIEENTPGHRLRRYILLRLNKGVPSRDTQSIYINHYGVEFSFHHPGININKLNQSAMPGQSCVDMEFSSLKWLNCLVTCATSWQVEWRMLYFIFCMTMRLMRWNCFLINLIFASLSPFFVTQFLWPFTIDCSINVIFDFQYRFRRRARIVTVIP